MSDIVCLREFGSRVQAELARELLAAHDIPSTVFADDGGGAFDGVLFSSGVAKLMVLPAVQQDAEEVLAAHEASRDQP
jgi:hypothetical protein